MVIKSSSPFGNSTRTRVLLSLSLLGESYARELARVLRAPLSGVQKALRSLELDGLDAIFAKAGRDRGGHRGEAGPPRQLHRGFPVRRGRRRRVATWLRSAVSGSAKRWRNTLRASRAK